MTEQERADLIAECKDIAQKEALRVMEGWLLRLPELIGSLIMQGSGATKATEKVFKDNPEFIKHQVLVAEIIRKHDAANPGKPFDELMKLALPEIKLRIEQVKGLSMTKTDRPADITFKPAANESSNGAL